MDFLATAWKHRHLALKLEYTAYSGKCQWPRNHHRKICFSSFDILSICKIQEHWNQGRWISYFQMILMTSYRIVDA